MPVADRRLAFLVPALLGLCAQPAHATGSSGFEVLYSVVPVGVAAVVLFYAVLYVAARVLLALLAKPTGSSGQPKHGRLFVYSSLAALVATVCVYQSLGPEVLRARTQRYLGLVDRDRFNPWPLAEKVAYVRAARRAPEGSRLPNADLRGADLAAADLRGVDLRRAKLDGAVLSGADLRRSDLRGASLAGANLKKADLTEADLTGCTGLETVLGLDEATVASAKGLPPRAPVRTEDR